MQKRRSLALKLLSSSHASSAVGPLARIIFACVPGAGSVVQQAHAAEQGSELISCEHRTWPVVLFPAGRSSASTCRETSRSPPPDISLRGLRDLVARAAWQRPTLAHEYLARLREEHRRDPISEQERVVCPSLFDGTWSWRPPSDSTASGDTASGSKAPGNPAAGSVNNASQPAGSCSAEAAAMAPPPTPLRPRSPLETVVRPPPPIAKTQAPMPAKPALPPGGINPPPPAVKVQIKDTVPPRPPPAAKAAKAPETALKATRPRGNRGGKNLEFWNQYYGVRAAPKDLLPPVRCTVLSEC